MRLGRGAAAPLSADRDRRSILIAPFGAAPVSVPIAHLPLASGESFGLFFVIAVAVAFATRQKPALACAAFIVTGPFDFARALGPTTLTLPKAVLLGAVVGLVARRVSLQPLFAGAVRPLLGGAAAIVFATALSALPAIYIDATARETLKALEYFITFACACVAFAEDPDETLLWNALGVTTLLVCALALRQDVTVAPSGIVLYGFTVPRIAGPLEGPNQLAGWCDLAIPMLAARALLGPQPALFAALAVLAVSTDALTLSRSSYLGLVPALAVVTVAAYRTGHRRRVTAGACCALVPFVALAALFAAHGVRSAPAEFLAWVSPGSGEHQLDNGLAPRAVLWRAAVELWKSDPGLGIGAGNYELLTPLVGLIGVRTHANSVYLQTLAEGGIPLLGATLWTIVAALALFLRRGSRGPLAIGIAGATVALAVHQGLDDLTFYPKIGGLWWTLLGAGAGAVSVARSKWVAG